jgi:hypothetical protein
MYFSAIDLPNFLGSGKNSMTPANGGNRESCVLTSEARTYKKDEKVD